MPVSAATTLSEVCLLANFFVAVFIYLYRLSLNANLLSNNYYVTGSLIWTSL